MKGWHYEERLMTKLAKVNQHRATGYRHGNDVFIEGYAHSVLSPHVALVILPLGRAF